MPVWHRLCGRPAARFRELGSPRILATAIFAPPGGCSFLWKNHWEVHAECRRESSLLRGFADFLRECMDVPRATPTRVTVVRRRAGSGGQALRRIANEGALLAALRTLGSPVEVVDFAELAYAEQMRRLATTRVLVGVTGAGLTNLLWLGNGAGVVELVPAPTYAPAVFGNLAAWRGLRYAAWRATVSPEVARQGSNVAEVEVDVEAVTGIVAELLART
jgi:hypothetical protein